MITKVLKFNKKVFLNTIIWGLVLWLIGYILGFIFFSFVPTNLIGWYILPIGVAITLWVLLKKIKRDRLKCYFGIAIFWTLIAIVFDYLFIVKLLNSPSYYKLDVYIYYLLTFFLPLIVGFYKFLYKQSKS